MSTGSTTCKLNDNSWVIKGDPHVMQRVVTCFPLAVRGEGGIRVPATPEQSRDLMWFRQRYPIEITPEGHVRRLAAECIRGEMQAEKILRAEYTGTTQVFADGLAPRDYQEIGAQLWPAVHSLLLGDDLGLGKTVTTLAALADAKMRPAAIVLPPALEMQWLRSIRKFLPNLTTHTIQSVNTYDLHVIARCPGCLRMLDAGRNKRCPKCRYRVPKERELPDLFICSYSKLHSWVDHLADVCQSVVYDEAHALRRDDSQKWRAAKALSSDVTYRLGLTATPLYNLGGEIWNIVEAIKPGFLGPKDQFRAHNCGCSRSGKEPALNDPDAFGSFLRQSNVLLRRTKADVGLDRGEVNTIVQEVQASGEIFNDATERASDLARVLLSGQTLGRGDAMRAAGEFESKLRQATGLAKAPYVAAFIEMLAEQEIPVVVWAWHLAVHDVLCEKLQKFNPVRYTGQESKTQKDASVSRFVNGDSTIFIGSLRSGEGLDGLQYRSSTAVFAELDWSDSAMKQCVGRLDRDGQEEAVTAYIMLSEYGLDPSMAEALEIKRGQLLGLLGERKTGPTRKVDTQALVRQVAQKYLTQRKR